MARTAISWAGVHEAAASDEAMENHPHDVGHPGGELLLLDLPVVEPAAEREEQAGAVEQVRDGQRLHVAAELAPVPCALEDPLDDLTVQPAQLAGELAERLARARRVDHHPEPRPPLG